MYVADFSEINKRVSPNKAVKEGFFLIYVGENQVLKGKCQKLIKLCRWFFLPKNNKICCMIIWQARVLVIWSLYINVREFYFWSIYSIDLTE